ncbi:hypothetical protein FEM48_Zijuj08G0010700 [Ziziphus jujuba var. spinosa]|uniref:Beta-galactosidase beta-sandwich domain-containing protein n=1 Tax=Ziziphus jujuba var. spinosa TaxID=714518 RepID=A0A978UW36_ZIZJJ|nr:hypothetical protein FEM48_Zijuj08G0010700 [Ziziphus jujuba var. spinosa]
MAVGLNTQVPWVMRKQGDAPHSLFQVDLHCQYWQIKDWTGCNFGRAAGGPFITTSYDYDAPIDKYAFLANYYQEHAVNVPFRNRQYGLPPWSISILPACHNESFNTARERKSLSATIIINGEYSFMLKPSVKYEPCCWSLEHCEDECAYFNSVDIREEEEFLKNGLLIVLNVSSAGHALQVFINGQLSEYWCAFRSKECWSYWTCDIGGPKCGNVGSFSMEMVRQDGVEGEISNLYSFKGSSSIKWAKGSSMPIKHRLTC